MSTRSPVQLPLPAPLRRRIRHADHAAFRRVARTEIPWVNPFLRGLTRACDWSMLWLGIAGILAMTGGRGRRAALRGVVAIALTSGTVNHPVKLLARRRRPDLSDVPEARQLAAEPGSWSFPSGHAASAFAFATATGAAIPALAVPLGTGAALVAYSRVHVGVHYPSDVLVGAALGSIVGVLTGAAHRSISPEPLRSETTTVDRERGRGG